MNNRKTEDKAKTAELHRMVTDNHLCPYGLKSKYLLQRQGYAIEDHWLTNRTETDEFKTKHGVKTTPQTFINGVRIGGYDDLRRYFGLSVAAKDAISYVPVIAIFGTSMLMALSLSWTLFGTVLTVRLPELFVATAMCILGVQKLQDVEQFSTMFLNYDILARRWVPYGYLYPFGETLAGILMLSGALIWLAAPVALFIGTVGAISVIKAVYIDRRELKCACVGGNSKVPLGFVSLTENLIMIIMGIWMPLRMFVWG